MAVSTDSDSGLRVEYAAEDATSGLRQRNNIGFGWAFLVVLALTAIVYVLALRSRLSSVETRRQIAGTPIYEPAGLAEA